VQALAGRGDILAAGFDGGVVLWDLSSEVTRTVTGMDGLPSSQVRALALDEREDILLAATRLGLARGWWEGSWTSALAPSTGCGEAFLCCTSRPGGGWVAGGERGLLAAWSPTRLDTLRLPRRDRIVALAHARGILGPGAVANGDVGARGTDSTRPEIAPPFRPGLVVATETDGLWILRAFGSRLHWLQLGARDGIPGRRLRAAITDSRSRLWIATDAGLACVEPGLVVRTWPSDTRLAPLARALHLGTDGWIYVGLDDGALRIDARTEHLTESIGVERVPGIEGPVRALATAGGTLWWTDGRNVRSLSGRSLEQPGRLPPVVCPIWIGRAGARRELELFVVRASRHRASGRGSERSGPVRPRPVTLGAPAGTLL
jgi:hypothetical protein